MFDAIADYFRLIGVASVLARHDVIAPEALRVRAPWPLKLAGAVLRLFPAAGGRGRPAERLALALERLGPAWIKLGQFLATRPDVIGVQAAGDLSRLKDALAPFPEKAAHEALEDEFGADARGLFPPLGGAVAAASVAQVHRVQTPEGERAVKILRPGVERVIARELRAMRRAARVAERSGHPEARRMEPVKFVDTLAQSLTREMDLRLEAGAASEFADIAAIDGFVHAPRVDWARTSRRVLTTEWVRGKGLTDPGALSGVDRVELANRVTRGFLAAALDHGFFHADLHEGNIILADDGRLVLVDYGIMGRIGPDERRFLAEILAGFLRRDYRRVSEVHFEAGYVPQGRSVEDFAQALRSVGEPIFGRTADEVSMARVLLQLFDITHQFGMHLRPELVLLQKTMVQVEGVARSIDPGHNIWRAADPIVSRWTRRQFGPEGLKAAAASFLGEGLKRLKEAPQRLERLEALLTERLVRPDPPPPRAPLWPAFLAGAAMAGLAAAALWGWFGR